MIEAGGKTATYKCVIFDVLQELNSKWLLENYTTAGFQVRPPIKTFIRIEDRLLKLVENSFQLN